MSPKHSTFDQNRYDFLFFPLIALVQFQKLRFRELDRFCLNGLSQLGDEERILTTISLKSILFNKYEV